MFAKRTLLLLTIGAATTTGALAQAQTLGFSGANIEASYAANYFSGSYSYGSTKVFGSIEYNLGDKFAVQIDLGTWLYDSLSTVDDISYGVQAIYRVSPNLAVGAYFTQDLWNNVDPYNNFGVEAKFTPDVLGGRLTIEAVAGIGSKDVNYPADYATIVSLGAEYGVTDNIDIGAGYTLVGWPDFNNYWNVALVDATYNFGSGLYVTASYSKSYWSAGTDSTYGLAVGFNFGNGTTFGRRSIQSFYPSY